MRAARTAAAARERFAGDCRSALRRPRARGTRGRRRSPARRRPRRHRRASRRPRCGRKRSARCCSRRRLQRRWPRRPPADQPSHRRHGDRSTMAGQRQRLQRRRTRRPRRLAHRYPLPGRRCRRRWSQRPRRNPAGTRWPCHRAHLADDRQRPVAGRPKPAARLSRGHPLHPRRHQRRWLRRPDGARAAG
ncbi:MAG: hypothetical protein AW07_04190 [Candidatus Accumulibacter sp. SK-11]|nr:MAG: hypothetical protein AW07_04190 [Candidatus Accumulibacter sp. SK-11]